MTTQMIICLVILLFSVFLFMFMAKKIPLGLSAMIAMMLFSLTGCLGASDALAGFANTSTILMGSMFIVSSAFNRTQFSKKLANGIAHIAKGSFTKVLFGYSLLTVLLLNFTGSPLATIAMIAPLLALSCESINVSPSKAMFGMSICTVAVANILPLSSAVVTAAQWNGYYEAQEYLAYPANMLDHLITRWPVLVFAIVYATFIAPKLSPAVPTMPINNMGGDSGKQEVLDPVKEKCGYIIFFLTIVGFLFAKNLGLATWQIAMIGAIASMMTGVLPPKDAMRAIPWNIIFLFAGCMSMGAALTKTGLGDLIGQGMANIVYTVQNPYVTGLLFFAVPFILTQFMSNTTVMLLFFPLVISMSKYMQINPNGLMIVVQQACLTALMTPLATTSTPLVMAYGGYDAKDLIKQGIIPGLLIGVITVFWVMRVMPF